jgi:hypothetical protein
MVETNIFQTLNFMRGCVCVCVCMCVKSHTKGMKMSLQWLCQKYQNLNQTEDRWAGLACSLTWGLGFLWAAIPPPTPFLFHKVTKGKEKPEIKLSSHRAKQATGWADTGVKRTWRKKWTCNRNNYRLKMAGDHRCRQDRTGFALGFGLEHLHQHYKGIVFRQLTSGQR